MSDEPNGNYNWRERMRRIESMERNWADQDRLNRNIEGLQTSMRAQKDNVDKLLSTLRDLIDRIPPENLR
jgi:uncharacterized coiled-coil protein SlyX